MNFCEYCYKELNRHIFCSNSCRQMYYLIKKKKGGIDNKTKCEICGWDATPCDRHRLDSTKEYCKENVVILCPNCHRTATMVNIAEKKIVPPTPKPTKESHEGKHFSKMLMKWI